MFKEKEGMGEARRQWTATIAAGSEEAAAWPGDHVSHMRRGCWPGVVQSPAAPQIELPQNLPVMNDLKRTKKDQNLP